MLSFFKGLYPFDMLALRGSKRGHKLRRMRAVIGGIIIPLLELPHVFDPQRRAIQT